MNDEEALKAFCAGIYDRCQLAIADAQALYGDEIADGVCDGYLAISAWCEDVIDGRALQRIVLSEM